MCAFVYVHGSLAYLRYLAERELDYKEGKHDKRDGRLNVGIIV